MFLMELILRGDRGIDDSSAWPLLGNSKEDGSLSSGNVNVARTVEILSEDSKDVFTGG